MGDMEKIDVILINENKLQSEYINSLFDPENFNLTIYYDGLEAYEFLISNNDISVIIVISHHLKNMTGLEIMDEIRKTDKDYGFIFVTADKSVERAVEAMKAGAIDFIPKTGNLSSDLVPLVEKASMVQQKKIERQRIEHELEEKNKELIKLSIVASETTNAVAIFNSELELEWVNKAFERIYGLTKKGFIEKYGSNILDSSSNPEILNLVQTCISTKRTIQYTLNKSAENVDSFWIQTTLTPVLDEQGEIFKLVTIDTDITELKEAELQIVQQQKNIKDSINYAQRIQSSIIPDNKSIREYFQNAFILYIPKDVVSGDFPWVFQNENNIYIAAVDCTGHGVPGALLSFVGHFHLNNIVDHERVLTTGEILTNLHKKVQSSLNQESADSNTRDGMDIALCKIDVENGLIEYSGAHRNLLVIRNGDIIEYSGDRKAIGGAVFKRRRKGKQPQKIVDQNTFNTYSFNFQENDRIYMFSDGLPDQINVDYKKYSTNRLKEVLLKNNGKPIKSLKKIINDDFVNWKGDYKQVDDILLIGIEF